MLVGPRLTMFVLVGKKFKLLDELPKLNTVWLLNPSPVIVTKVPPLIEPLAGVIDKITG